MVGQYPTIEIITGQRLIRNIASLRHAIRKIAVTHHTKLRLNDATSIDPSQQVHRFPPRGKSRILARISCTLAQLSD